MSPGWRARRLALGWWRRTTRWEFWPMWPIYLPVLASLPVWAWRYGGLNTFAAVNPGMADGGFVGESKWDIHQRLGGDANPRLPRTTLLPEGPVAARLAAARAFAEAAGLGFPLVFKPEAGQRGEGVVIVRSWAQAERVLGLSRVPTLVQEHLAGLEFGVFYARRPGAAQGELLSVAWKQPLELRGDGQSTLERLILADERAVCQAPLHLSFHAARLQEVPAAGERVRLVEVGAHCRGTVFRDARQLRTSALRDALDGLLGGFEGGYFLGRLDVRAASEEALQRGELRVIEVNGVTAEQAHIYDPDAGLLDAWRDLRAQWRLAFEIGAANRAAGHEPRSSRALFAAWRAHEEGAGERAPVDRAV